MLEQNRYTGVLLRCYGTRFAHVLRTEEGMRASDSGTLFKQRRRAHSVAIASLPHMHPERK